MGMLFWQKPCGHFEQMAAQSQHYSILCVIEFCNSYSGAPILSTSNTNAFFFAFVNHFAKWNIMMIPYGPEGGIKNTIP